MQENKKLQATLGLCCMTSTSHNKVQYKTFRINGFEKLTQSQQFEKVYAI
jgi:UV DNA damage repair endonuclease